MMKRYTDKDLEAAIKDVHNGMSKKTAAELHQVPRATLQYRLKNNGVKNNPGPPPYLSNSEEQEFVNWIIDCHSKGYPRRKEDLRLNVQNLFDSNPNRPSPFKENLPGYGWFKAFLKRHPESLCKMFEAVKAPKLNEDNVREWFNKVEELLNSEGAKDILKRPDRMFVLDEINFLLDDNNEELLPPKNQRKIINKCNDKKYITTLLSLSALGNLGYPLVVYPYETMPTNIVKHNPRYWRVGKSSSGLVQSEHLYDYLKNIFIPHLKTNKVPLPVVLFIDSVKPYITMKSSQLCQKEGIVMIAFFPNLANILQPTEVSFFKPMKKNWKNYLKLVLSNSSSNVVTKEKFVRILKLILDHSNRTTVKSGFAVCGLFPWNPDVINYTKCYPKVKIRINIVPKIEKEIDKAVNINNNESSSKILNLNQVCDTIEDGEMNDYSISSDLDMNDDEMVFYVGS